MSFDAHNYFQRTCNKQRIHIEQLRSTRDDKNTNDVVRQRLQTKITRERQQLAIIDDIWDVR